MNRFLFISGGGFFVLVNYMMAPMVTPLFTDCLFDGGYRCDFGVHGRLEPVSELRALECSEMSDLNMGMLKSMLFVYIMLINCGIFVPHTANKL